MFSRAVLLLSLYSPLLCQSICERKDGQGKIDTCVTTEGEECDLANPNHNCFPCLYEPVTEGGLPQCRDKETPGFNIALESDSNLTDMNCLKSTFIAECPNSRDFISMQDKKKELGLDSVETDPSTTAPPISNTLDSEELATAPTNNPGNDTSVNGSEPDEKREGNGLVVMGIIFGCVGVMIGFFLLVVVRFRNTNTLNQRNELLTPRHSNLNLYLHRDTLQSEFTEVEPAYQPKVRKTGIDNFQLLLQRNPSRLSSTSSSGIHLTTRPSTVASEAEEEEDIGEGVGEDVGSGLPSVSVSGSVYAMDVSVFSDLSHVSDACFELDVKKEVF